MPKNTTEHVSNAPFREEFLRNEELTSREVCEAAGWMMKMKGRRGQYYVGADTGLLQRKLGIKPDTRLKGNPTRTTIPYDEAVKLVGVFGFDPVDVDV